MLCRPQTRPKEQAIGTISRGLKAAVRMEHACFPRTGGRDRRFGCAVHRPNASMTRSISSGLFSGVAINTKKSRSAYSHSAPAHRSFAARAWPVPSAGTASVNRRGSHGSVCQPASANLSRTFCSAPAVSSRRSE